MQTLDVVIPCYNAAGTLDRAVDSALSQSQVGQIILVDDGSTDDTANIIAQYSQAHTKIQAINLGKNSGVATARNVGAMVSGADLVAFLDADDAYEANALDVVPVVFDFIPTLVLLKLRLIPKGVPSKYLSHKDFDKAWDNVQMTGGGNTIYRRSILTMTGFPRDGVFRRFGGEDSALSIAIAECCMVGTLFDDIYQGVEHYWRDGVHAQRLLDSMLFGINSGVTIEDMSQARQVTDKIKSEMGLVKGILSEVNIGRRPILIEFE